MANEARLNLVISAQDQAKTVIEEMVNNIKSAFEGLKNLTMNFDTAGMDQSLQSVAESAMSTRTSLEESITGMKSSADTLSASITEATDKSAQSFMSLDTTLRTVSDQLQQSLDGIGQSAQHMDQSLDFMNLQMAGQMIQQVGEQITGFFEHAVSSAADFDQNVVNTTASLDANMGVVKLNTQQIQAMQQAAIDMGNSGFFSANQVADAMNTMAKQGLTYQQIMSGGIDTVYKVAAANQQDLETTANVVADIYNEMGDIFAKSGMSAQQAANMIGNSMTVALHHARISMDDFMNTMKYVGPQASAMGIGIKDVSTAIALLGEHGIRGTQAGTTLRTMMTNLTPVSKAAAAQMKDLGMITKDGANIFYDASGKMKPLAEVQQILHDKLSKLSPEMEQLAIKTIFGRYALSGMTAIVGTAPSKFQELNKAMDNNNTMTDIMKEKSTGLGMQIEKLNAHWQTVQKTIGEALKPMVESLISGLNSLMKGWESLSPGVKQAIVVFTAVSGVLLLVGGGLFALIGTIGMFMTAFTAGIGVLSAISLPIVAIVAAIVAAVALIGVAGYQLYKHWDQVKAWMIGIWNTISTTAISVWNSIKSFLTTTFNSIVTTTVSTWNNFSNGIRNIWNSIVSWIKGAAQDFANAIVDAFNWMYNHNYYFKDLVDFIRNAWKTIQSDAQSMWNAITSALTNAWNSMSNTARSVWNSISSFLRSLWNSIVSAAKSMWNGLSSFLSGLWNSISSAVSNAWNAISSTMSSKTNQAISAVKGPFQSLGSFFQGLWGQAEQWGANLVNMMAQGIKNAAGAVGNAVKSVASSISSFLGFHSPYYSRALH